MPLLRDLSRRDLQPEIMDQLDLDSKEHARALAGLKRINAASFSAESLWRCISSEPGLTSSHLKIADLASGGGDTCLRIWRKAKKAKQAVEIVGLERSPTAIEIAEQQCRVASEAIRFEETDVVDSQLPKNVDVMICSLFLHHLSDSEVSRFLRNIAEAAPKLLLLSDLRRSTYGYFLAHLACRTLSRSAVVHYDGPQSVAAAFSIAEVKSLCQEAGLSKARIHKCWPARFLMEWRAQ